MVRFKSDIAYLFVGWFEITKTVSLTGVFVFV